MLTLVSHYVSLRSIKKKTGRSSTYSLSNLISLPHQPTGKSLLQARVAQNHNTKFSFTNLHRDHSHCLNVTLCHM
jgi:hypothetical protein